MRWLVFLFLVLASVGLKAEDWQYLGDSDIGKYYADRESIKREPLESAFVITTKVIEKDKAEWLTSIRVDCGNNMFNYLSGKKTESGKLTLYFDTPRASEGIQAGSMPDLLRSEYCGTVQAASSNASELTQWELAGKSTLANVYFDRKSYRTAKDGFVIDTKVVPFSTDEESFGKVEFDCAAETFTMLKLEKLRNGKMERVIDKPQPPVQTGKMATLKIVADKFCTRQPVSGNNRAQVCSKAIARMQALEGRIQAEVDKVALQCSQVESYIKQVGEIKSFAKQHECAIGGLDAYIQSIKSADCVKQP